MELLREVEVELEPRWGNQSTFQTQIRTQILAVTPSDLERRARSQVEPKPVESDEPINFDDVCGFTGMKKKMDEIFLKKSSKSESKSESKSKVDFPEKEEKSQFILFFGPNGGGKTRFIESLASEYKVPLFFMRISDVVSKWVGQAEKNVFAFLSAAKKAAEESESGQSIICIDHAACLLGKRYQVDYSFQKAILEAVSGPESSSSSKVVWIAATDRPDLLDPKFLPHFTQKIFLPLPDAEIRQQVLERGLSARNIKVDKSFLKQLLRGTKRFSFRELEFFLSDVDAVRLQKLMSATHWKKVTMDGPEKGLKEEWKIASPGDPEAIAGNLKEMDHKLISLRNVPLSREEIVQALKERRAMSFLADDKEFKRFQDFNILHNRPEKNEDKVERRNTRANPSNDDDDDDDAEDKMAEEEENCWAFWDLMGLCI